MTVSSVKGVFLDASTLGNDIDLTPLTNMDCQCWPTTSSEQLLERCKAVNYIVTNKVVISADVMRQLPELKLICVAATGMNNVDLVAAEELGISVKNVTDYAGSSIAQLVFSLLSELLLHTRTYIDLVKDGAWSKSPHFCLFDKPIVELAGKKIVLVGYGSLAKSVERIALAYDMEVLVAARKVQVEIPEGRVQFEQALKLADIVSIHCPLTSDTENLISTSEFELMKPSAVIINTARGGIVDEIALLEALQNKKIAAAATDVLSQEPPTPEHPLLSSQPDNLIITPHIAWATVEARKRVLDKVINNITQHFVG